MMLWMQNILNSALITSIGMSSSLSQLWNWLSANPFSAI